MDEIVVLIQDRPALSVQKNASHGMRAMHPLQSDCRTVPFMSGHRSPVTRRASRLTCIVLTSNFVRVSDPFMIYLSPHPMPKILAGLPADLTCPNVLVDKN